MQTVTAADRRGGKGRLLGVDAARAIALIGMMAVHLLPSTDPDGTISVAYLIASGRSSALFAVLAGVGLALATGATTPPVGRARWAAAAGIGGRALILTFIGLLLGDIESGVAVILVNYGFLFLVGALLIGLSARVAGWLAVGWLVFAPFVSHWLRMRLPSPSLAVPGFTELADPLAFLTEILFTGYYPVFTWIAYLLTGLAVGRLRLASQVSAVGLLAVGLIMAVGAKLFSAFLLDELGGRDAVGKLPIQFFGTTPTNSWWYLAVDTPHSGTPLHFAHTIGSALAVLGACLLLASAGRYVVAWLAGAGGMTLSLYTSHVVVLATRLGLDDRPRLLLWNVVGAVLIGFVWRRFVGRGPLENLTANVAGSLKSAVLSYAPTRRSGAV
ncbi:MAG: heparan-alpha-glucosaminide N-acetyltransferase domain-containing protein [Acidimicrobiia bacterium]